MKKSLLILLALLMVGIGYAQKAPATKLISSSEDQIVVTFQLSGYNTSKVMTPQGEQFVVNASKMAPILEAGAPDLPMFPIPAIIGDRAEMTVSVIDAQYTDYENMEIAPSKGNLSRQVNPDEVPYTYGEMYQQNAFWPATPAYLEKPYILRDFRGQNIMVRPFAYNPVTKTLRVYTSMTIAMTKVSDNGQNQKLARKSSTIKMDPEQKAQYSRRFINFGEIQNRYPFDEDYGEMLIICPDQYMSEMTEFVEWKNKSGRPTTLVSVTAAGGNNDTQIKNYIQNIYNDPNHNLEFILLIGEYNDLTPHSMNGGRSDNWFGMLEGSDYYLEALVGRFSIQNANQLQTHINKVLYYERDMQAGVTWVDRGMGIGAIGAGSGHFGEDDYQHIDYIRDTLLHYTYNQVTEHHQGGDASVSTISGTTNEGISVINYCNHGSETSWGVANYSVSNVNALTNDNKLPIVWSVACLNGKFDVGECFGEAWLRATNNSTGAPTGAIGGMFSWISQPWIPPMYGQDEMVEIFAEWKSQNLYNRTLGGVSLNGAMYILDAAPSDNGETQNTWLLFGDPSCMVRSANPTSMNVTASPSTLMLGMDALTVNANADYAIATLSMNGEIIATGKVVNGQCTLNFPALNQVGNADLVVLGYNKVTYMGTVEIVPAAGAYVTVNDYVLSGPANYGETIDLDVEVKNVGVETTNNVTITLSTESDYLTITSAEGTVASLAAGATTTVEGFQFAVAENIPDGEVAQIDVTMTSGTNTWTGKIMVNLHAPILVLESLSTTEDAASFTFKNNGSAPFYGGNLTITSCSPDLVFDPETINYEGDVNGGESITLVSQYSVDENVEPGTTFQVAYDFTTGLFEIDGIFVVSYGAIQEDFESGTFSNNWTFSPTNAWTIVEGAGVNGSKCAKSTNEGLANTDYSMTLTVNVLAAGNLTFMYKVSSENNYDKLRFYMDNQQKGEWSGTVAWTEFTQPVTVGNHTFKWEYHKDSSVNSGSDCAWVDDIIFPPTHVITFIAPATDLVATVDDHDVNLTWTASAEADTYLVARDGETIGTTTETTFDDFLEAPGIYKYSVYAVDANGSMSAPVSVFVNLEFTGIEENADNFEIYPNPANSTLFIQGGNAEYSYIMFNGMGQQVVNGNARGTETINVSNMSKGVYFLRITTGNGVSTKKVVVE